MPWQLASPSASSSFGHLRATPAAAPTDTRRWPAGRTCRWDGGTGCIPRIELSPRNHHQRHPVERRVVVAEGAERVGDAHEALGVPAGVEEKIEAVERTFELLVEFDGSVGRQIVAISQLPRGTT